MKSLKSQYIIINGDIDILNVYNSPKTLINVVAFSELITNRYTILVGDFNALNTMWQANHTNVNDRVLEQFLDASKLCLLKDTTPTRNGIDGSANILYLAITTNIVASTSFCKVTPYNCSSDYHPSFK